MTSELPAIGQGLVFSEGFLWDRGFVKRADNSGRNVQFRISAQLVTNCLAPTSGALDPISAFNSNDGAVQAACRRALDRAGHERSSIDVLREDFG
jgi:hypothetical protein